MFYKKPHYISKCYNAVVVWLQNSLIPMLPQGSSYTPPLSLLAICVNTMFHFLLGELNLIKPQLAAVAAMLVGK